MWTQLRLFANSVDPDQEQSDQGPHVCLYAKIGLKVCKNIQQTTFSAAGFLAILRVQFYIVLELGKMRKKK